MTRRDLRAIFFLLIILTLAASALARNPYRRDFFDAYPVAEGTQLDDLPSNAGHCGVCHFDFDGGGARNPYGLAVEVAINSGQYASDLEAIVSVESQDSDGDGFTSLIEITDLTNFGNTPTFPGLSASNLGSVLTVDPLEVEPYLTPSGGSDTTPPLVTVLSPNGGESYPAASYQTVSWTASDESGVTQVDLHLSIDGGASFFPLAEGLPNDGSASLFYPLYPGTGTWLKVLARDGAGNWGDDSSDAAFILQPFAGGVVPTTLRDFDMPGTQPLEGAIVDDPEGSCRSCHGDFDTTSEPWHTWQGGMMSQAMRDPHFRATMVIAEQDAPGSGDLCLRCHTPGGWQEGHSFDTTGGMVTAKDRQGIHCDFCHRMVDPHYEAGVSPVEDLAVLDALDELPVGPANGQFINDPAPVRRGPYADALASHQFLESPFHRESDLCGTCHDVSNPAFVRGTDPLEYSPNDFDAPHPDGDRRNMFPVERTFSEWEVSEYATTGVYAPQFAGDLPSGIVSSCQDCHMHDVTGMGANTGPVRGDMPLHDLTGGNHWVPDLLPSFYPDEVDPVTLQAAKARVISMLQLGATLELSTESYGAYPELDVRVINETGHKLPSGYPEGRRMWINVKAYDEAEQLVYESAAYDAGTGVLSHDEDAKIYEIEPGTSTRLANLLGLEAGPSFHFVLNDTVWSDNRIPPRGFTNAAFTEIQSPPVGYEYEDGEYWDDTEYILPTDAVRAEVTLYYQSASKEYVDFLRDENTTNDLGQQLHDAWSAQGKAAPVAMASASIDLAAVGVGEDAPPARFLDQNRPNPFNPSTLIRFGLAEAGPVTLKVYDAQGRLQRVLSDSWREAGEHELVWDGRDDQGRRLSSGVYHCRLEGPGIRAQRKMTLLK